jgi:hypothetical protein
MLKFAIRQLFYRNGMKAFTSQFAMVLGIFAFLSMPSVWAVESAIPPAKANAQIDDNDEGGDWIFDSGPYTNNPKTGERVWQYAKVKPVYESVPNYMPIYAPSYYSLEPRSYSGDPFFLLNTDKMFFMNHPDPFYAEPTGYPGYYNGVLGADRFLYGLESRGYNYDGSEN